MLMVAAVQNQYSRPPVGSNLPEEEAKRAANAVVRKLVLEHCSRSRW